ncbi:diacylglycerol/lipid kinase family protein [Nocardioides panacisoli]|uniref:Diacylglycerol kinase family protein n=1 Tax=Nocardioides panacisoli TaxID=627624 RepID=A0ABP7IJ18_9ACTN
MSRSFSFLVNPLSGGGTAARVVVPLARRLREEGAEVEVTYTGSVDEVPALVAAAAAADAVLVAVGGDGMVSSVAGEVATAGGVLALVPAGRGNDFVRQLGLPHDEAAQVEMLLHGEERRIDLLAAASGGVETFVAGSVYCGVDARAGELVNKAHWLPSKLQYPVSTVRALATYRPFDLTLDVDGVRTEHRAACVVVANSGFYGKGVHIAPAAVVDDGELDVVVIEAAGRIELIRSLPKAYDGSHVDLDEVTVLRGRKVAISGAYRGGATVPVGADGEPMPALGPDAPLGVEVRPGAVRILG